MAVQAQYPSNVILPDYRNIRARHMFGAGSHSRSFMHPVTFDQSSLLDDFQIQPDLVTVVPGAAHPQLRMNFNQLPGVTSHREQSPAIQMSNTLINKAAESELACNLLTSRKRAREDEDLSLVNSRQQHQHQQQQQQLQQQQQQLLNIEYQQTHHGSGTVLISQGTGVSTCLNLAFEEDDRLNSTSSASTSCRDVSPSLLAAMGEDLSRQLQQQREEVEQFFKLQGEQVRQQLEEKRQRHSLALLGAIEEGLSRRLREKDVEIEKMRLRNQELAKHAEQLAVEAHHWQAKVKSSEALVSALRANLQQTQAASREQSKEGCGDSEADDAASSHHGDVDDIHARTFKENRELREQRTCRSCRTNDVSVLLLPCRHLCLCKECEARLDACPLCHCLKNASVQVYMS